MKYMFAMGVEQVLTKYQVNKLQTWAAWPIFQIKEPKRLKLPRVSSHPELRYGTYIFIIVKWWEKIHVYYAFIPYQ